MEEWATVRVPPPGEKRRTVNLKNLSTETMAEISSQWLDPEGLRPDLEAVPLLAAMLPMLEEAHSGLACALPSDESKDERLKSASEEQARLDARHDAKKRGAFNLLEGLRELTDDPARAKGYEALRDALFPEKSADTQRSYVHQAGAAKLLSARLDEELKKKLNKVPAAEGKLLDAVEAWIHLAAEIGKLEEQKGARLTELKSKSMESKQRNELRFQWIRVAHGLERNLKLAKVNAKTSERILASLRKAESKAERSVTGAKEQDEPPAKDEQDPDEE